MIEYDAKAVEKFRVGPIKKFFMWFARMVCVPPVGFFYLALNRSRAVGLENVPDGPGVVFTSNHISAVDTFMIPYFTVGRLSLTPYFSPAKEELFKGPVMSSIMPLLGSFPVKRGQRDYSAMRRIAYIAKHYRMMLFPEGTRSKTGKLLKGRAGVGWTVYHSRPKVIPTLMINTETYFLHGPVRRWFCNPYTICFGPELDLSRFYEMEDNKATSQAIADEIMKAIGELKEKYKDLYV